MTGAASPTVAAGLTFVAHGPPAGKGSTRAFPVRRADGRDGVAVTHDSPRTRRFEDTVRDAAIDAHAGRPLLDGPLELELTFRLARPRGHYGSGRNHGRLRPSAPPAPAVTPDLDKLVRVVGDALTRAVITDDARIVALVARKCYDAPEGVSVTITPYSGRDPSDEDERIPRETWP
jgi:Holliday junction resolvase RusA-like endonuclease